MVEVGAFRRFAPALRQAQAALEDRARILVARFEPVGAKQAREAAQEVAELRALIDGPAGQEERRGRRGRGSA
jgi:hypothetical protein